MKYRPTDVRPQPSQGQFPFRLLGGDSESLFVTRLRNYSSYLTAGGMRSGLDAIACYTRGVLGNLLILLPILLLIGCALGVSHFAILANPLTVSKYLLAGLALSVVVFFVFDSAMRRWKWVRVIPRVAIVLLLIAAVFESSPLIIEFFRKNPLVRNFGLKESFAVVFTIASVAGTLAKSMPKFGKLRLTLLALSMSLLSAAMVWVVTLSVSNYVAYGIPPHNLSLKIPLGIASILAASIIAFAFIAPFSSWGNRILAVATAVMASCMLVFLSYCLTHHIRDASVRSSRAIGTITRPLARVINGLKQAHATTPPELFSEVDSIALDKEALDRIADARGTLRWGDEEDFFNSLNPAYYHQAVLFLERNEILGNFPLVDQQRLLSSLAVVGKNKLIGMSRPKDAQPLSDLNSQELRNEGLLLESVVLDLLVEEFIRNKIGQSQLDYASLPNDENRWFDMISTQEELEAWLREQRTSVSRARDYLTLTGKTSEIDQWENVSSPDTAFNGPHLVDTSIERQSQIGEARKTAILRVVLGQMREEQDSSIIDSLPPELKSSFASKLSELQAELQVRKIDFDLLLELVIADEEHVNAKGIRDYCGLESEPTKVTQQLANAKRMFAASKPLSEFSEDAWKRLARQQVMAVAISPVNETASFELRKKACHVLQELFHPQVPLPEMLAGTTGEQNAEAFAIYRRPEGKGFSADEFRRIVAASYLPSNSQPAEDLVRQLAFGNYANFEGIATVGYSLFSYSWYPKVLLVVWISAGIALFCVLFIDPNATSIHSFYRDQLATAFLLRRNTDSSVGPDTKVLLSALCQYYDPGCIAPYHLINVAINMQGSKRADIRDRYADFFTFSKLFVGGESTGYVRTKSLEAVCSDLNTASAMAISAGAASPNMGKYTNGFLTFVMTLLNVRLGFWIPNPSAVNRRLNSRGSENEGDVPKGFEQVFEEELRDILRRRSNLKAGTEIAGTDRPLPSVNHHLFGLALSGGGIRSAAINLGVLQYLESRGMFSFFDYMSTVSGGGYLGTGVSVFMRSSDPQKGRTVGNDIEVMGDPATPSTNPRPANAVLRWKPQFWLLFLEMSSRLNERGWWINLTDGGHVENLGVYQLLRRRCEIIVAGDGEADADGRFDGLAALLRLAEIDLGVHIEFKDADIEALTPSKRTQSSEEKTTAKHFAVGKIYYPARPESNIPAEHGFILYLKSSMTNNADVVTKSYRGFNPSFPHESTANQFFKEGQFEAYRRLGVELAMEAITYMGERMRQIECKSPKQLRDWLSSEFDDGEENTRETGTET